MIATPTIANRRVFRMVFRSVLRPEARGVI
jgi:hypothetical protein